MSRLDQEPEVIALATELGLKGQVNPVEAIVRHCLTTVGKWVADHGLVSSIGDLENVVARHLGMVFEDVWTDADLDAVIRKYVMLGDPVFAYLTHDLDGSTFGATYRRRNAAPNAPDRLVAIIDCRGEKGSRRFFTRWHEIAHFLVQTKASNEPVHRSTDTEPLERMMDEIAAHVGFYEPIFMPVFQSQMTSQSRLSFQVVEAVRQRGFGDASFQSTLFACHRRIVTPVVYVEAAIAHKAENEREIKRGTQWLFEDARPEAVLRAVQVVPNAVAQGTKLFIAPNMRVPPSSMIHRLFFDNFKSDVRGQENLSTWEHSGGKRLADREIWIEAKKIKEQVIAIVQPLD